MQDAVCHVSGELGGHRLLTYGYYIEGRIQGIFVKRHGVATVAVESNVRVNL
jgi:hypothetical protein